MAFFAHVERKCFWDRVQDSFAGFYAFRMAFFSHFERKCFWDGLLLVVRDKEWCNGWVERAGRTITTGLQKWENTKKQKKKLHAAEYVSRLSSRCSVLHATERDVF